MMRYIILIVLFFKKLLSLKLLKPSIFFNIEGFIVLKRITKLLMGEFSIVIEKVENLVGDTKG